MDDQAAASQARPATVVHKTRAPEVPHDRLVIRVCSIHVYNLPAVGLRLFYVHVFYVCGMGQDNCIATN